MERDISSSNLENEIQTNTGLFEGKGLMPSQYYVDLFYSQLAYSYYGSLHFHWRENLCRIIKEKGFSGLVGKPLNTDFHDPLSHLADKGITSLLKIYSDSSQDSGPQMQLTGSVFYRGDSDQVLLAQAYDSSVKNPKECDVTTEFSLIAEYESQNKVFSYPGEKKYSINPWERYHISILMKAIFVFMFFDVSREFYIVLISLYFLYIRGLFDGLQDLFEKISSSQPMDTTLAELRRRRAEIELEAQMLLESEQELLNNSELDRVKQQTEDQAVDREVLDSSQSQTNPTNGISEDGPSQEVLPSEEFEDGSSVISAYEEAHFLDPLGVLGPNEVLSASQAEGLQDLGDNSKRDNTTETQENTPEVSGGSQVNQQSQAVNYLTCIIYQTIGMYIFTLMPWWNPDPTYLV
ncbi:multi-pass transmembrane [Cryptosporidium sp. chipmunk genotype I]|uniref:multi-pass transmembrane n=1 Tax=Cryptosporidium sp. chipmunk genotype I TaxID=1280935 RepID=UPI00351A7297|nr:multi-pass transmembrane [Cryptosporidium sp. chipmunk genotype I]